LAALAGIEVVLEMPKSMRDRLETERAAGHADQLSLLKLARQQAQLGAIEAMLGQPGGRADALPASEGTVTSGQPAIVTPPAGTIWLVGEGYYMVGGWDGVVNDAEDNVLQAFIKQKAQNGPTLKRTSGENDPGRVLRALRRKYGGAFADAIHLAVRKGRRGYVVCVEDRRPKPRPS
jgi:hypothetical protein